MTDRPNLLLFMPETVRADAMIGPAETRARTPNTDRLAEQGVTLTQCFAQAPYCSPSRCSMFTGLYPHTTGHRSLLHLLRADEHHLFRDLKEAGYRNVVYGKNDLLARDAVAQCFDEFTLRVAPTGPGHMPNTWPEDHKFRNSFYRGCREGTDVHDGDWACTQSALQFLDEDHDRPFCLYLPLSFAHPPYEVEEPFFSMHDRAAIPEPIPADTATKRSYMQLRHQAHGCDRLSDEDFREIKATYFGMVSRVDHQLGLLLDKLRRRGLEDNTIVVVFSDHGDYAGDYGMIEKFMAGFEDCMLHVPLVIRAPGLSPAGPRDALCEMTDLYPTLMELLGLAPKHYHYGQSLVPLIHDAGAGGRDAVFAEGGYHADETQFLPHIPDGSDYAPMARQMRSHPGMARKAAMVRTDRYKYVYCPEDRDELYDRQSDPHELNNLAAAAEAATVRDALRERLMRWMLDTGDMLPMETDPRGWQ